MLAQRGAEQDCTIQPAADQDRYGSMSRSNHRSYCRSTGKTEVPRSRSGPPGGPDSAKMESMLQRKYLFPRVIELNYQAGRRLRVNVYLIDGGGEWLLIDVGYEDALPE